MEKNERKAHNHQHAQHHEEEHPHHSHEHHHEEGHPHEKECGCGHPHHSHSHCHEEGYYHKEDCGCGHDHHHHHEEDCGCGHHHGGHEGHDHSHHAAPHEPHTMPADIPQKVYILQNLGCANCAAKMERKINALPEVDAAVITFATRKLAVASGHQENLLPVLQKICASIESEVTVVPEEETAVKKEKRSFFASNRSALLTIGSGAVLFAAGIITKNTVLEQMVNAALFIAAYLVLGLAIV